MLGQSQSIAVSKTTNPRWTAPEVIRDFILGPAGDGEFVSTQKFIRDFILGSLAMVSLSAHRNSFVTSFWGPLVMVSLSAHRNGRLPQPHSTT